MHPQSGTVIRGSIHLKEPTTVTAQIHLDYIYVAESLQE